MSNFLFEGDFYRKPGQRLGGVSKTGTKDDVLRRAHAERRRRENERLHAKSVLVIQSAVRSFLSRCQTKRALRLEFDSFKDKEGTSQDEGSFERQFSLLSFFYRQEVDLARLHHLSTLVNKNKLYLINRAKVDSVWVLRIIRILRVCVKKLNASKANQTIYLRLIEMLTEDASFTDEGQIIMCKLWLDIIVGLNFFGEMRKLIESKIPEPNTPTPQTRNFAAQPLLILLTRPFYVYSGLKNRSDFTFKVGRVEIKSGEKGTKLMLSKFTDVFSKGIIPLEHDDRHKKNSNVSSYLIFPYLLRIFPWADLMTVVEERVLKTEEQTRNLLFYTLALYNPHFEWTSVSVLGDFVRAIVRLIKSIECRYEPFYNACAPGELEYEESEDEDMEASNEIILKLKESKIIFNLLKTVINVIPLTTWVENQFGNEWENFLNFVGSLIRLDPRLASIHFKFLSRLSFDKKFLRALFDKLIQERLTNKGHEGILVFAWLFNHLMSTLHDAEFFQEIPLSNSELSDFTAIMRSIYVDLILNDKEDELNFETIDLIKVLSLTLNSIYERNTRMMVYPEELFVSKSFSLCFPFDTHSFLFQDFGPLPPTQKFSPMELKLIKVLRECPFVLRFQDRVTVWNRLIEHEKFDHFRPGREHIQIRREFIYEDSFEKLSPENVRDLKDDIRISLVNIVGVMEAGVDGGGLLREFLSEATKAGVQPNLGLFRYDSQNRLYPNPIAKKIIADFKKHFFLMGRLVGKALYEQTLLELPFSAIFVHKFISGNVASAVDYLAILEPEMHKNLLALKHFKGDWNSLGLDFTLTVEELGETRSIELKLNGSSIPVDKSNIIEYIHLVGDYKVNREIEEECKSFRQGLNDVVPLLRLFSWAEMQIMISGSEKHIEVEDWMENTNYIGVYNADHPTIILFWNVVKRLNDEDLRKLLKFVTSCTRPPLLGFSDLVPKFGIQSGGSDTDRLPTSATCMNLLKLPEYTNEAILEDRIRYAINSGAGFELS